VSDLELYEIASKSERELYGKNVTAITDPARRRETKIKQYQAEKEIRSRIEVNKILLRRPTLMRVSPPYQAIAKRQRVLLPPSDASPTDFDLIAALLPQSAPGDGTLNGEEVLDDTEDERRTATLLLLRLAYAQAHAQLSSIAEEFELLRTAPPPPPDQPGTSGPARSSPEADRALWSLDAPRGGPLLDSTGKVREPSSFTRLPYTSLAHENEMQLLQPITISPSGTGGDGRARLREQVFQPDYRLPTMTIDEYLEIERQRGNFLTGGG
jgi:immunoglobulin-binding protein 1